MGIATGLKALAMTALSGTGIATGLKALAMTVLSEVGIATGSIAPATAQKHGNLQFCC